MIINFGSLNIDNVYKVEEIVSIGETIATTKYEKHIGGKGLNQSVAISRSGNKAAQIGKISNTDNDILKFLNNNNIDTSYLEFSDQPQGQAIIQVDKAGNNSIIILGGSNTDNTILSIDKTLQNFGSKDVIVLQNEVNEIEHIIKTSHNLGMKIFLNPSPVDDTMKNLDYNLVDWIFINEVEGLAITKKQNPEDVLKYFKQNFPNLSVVLTLGENGSICLYKGENYYQKAFKTKVIDTTAAGDTFTGYFISKFQETNNIKLALQYSAIAASISISVNGAANSIPFKSEVDKLLNELS